MDLALYPQKFINIGIVGIKDKFGGFGGFDVNEKTYPCNIYYHNQKAKSNEQIRLEYFRKIETCTKQKSQPIPIPKRKNFF
jgi:hypothetical protein